jgi:hypothetical protein
MDDMTNRKMIPVDEHKVTESDPAAGEYEEATRSGRDIREMILSNPMGRKSYERAVAEIESHQANLAQVRKLRFLAQSTVAELMEMDQSEISRLERRSDLLLSTLRKFIQATGGDLHLVAQFPEGNVELLIGDELSDGLTEANEVNV